MAKRRISINSLRNLRQYRDMFKIPDPEQFEMDAIMTLADIGEKIIKMAYSTKTYKDRTFNLRDSYVSAVFKNGRMVPNTNRYVGDPKSTIALEYDLLASGDPEMTTGREEADKFLAKWGFAAGRGGGLVLVVAAAMFYSGILESDKYNYLVISHIDKELQELSARGFTTMKYKAHIDGKYIKQPSIFRESGQGRMQVING